MTASLVAKSLQKQYPTRAESLVVLSNVSLSLEAGQAAAVMGPSGSGKSTLLNILGTLDTPTAGSLQIDGVDPLALPEAELARFRNTRLGFVFQDHHLLPQCSALENVLIPTLAGPPSNQATDRARFLLDSVGLSQRLDHRPAELSGGERQRVAIARALINDPLLVLADEPTGNLDRTTAGVVMELLFELHRKRNNMLVVVTHSTALIEHVPGKYELIDGTLAPL